MDSRSFFAVLLTVLSAFTAAQAQESRFYIDLQEFPLYIKADFKGDISFDNSKAGPQAVTIKSLGQTASFRTEVMELTGISARPSTSVYQLGFAPPNWRSGGLDIQGTWNQMGSEKLDYADCQVSIPSNTDMATAGTKIVTVDYKGKQTSFNIEVVALQRMRITSNPTKLTYQQGEALQTAGLKVTGVWPRLPEGEVPIALLTVTGYNANTVGNQTVTVTKDGRTASFTVTVAERRP
jgi:hypothetical protein